MLASRLRYAFSDEVDMRIQMSAKQLTNKEKRPRNIPQVVLVVVVDN